MAMDLSFRPDAGGYDPIDRKPAVPDFSEGGQLAGIGDVTDPLRNLGLIHGKMDAVRRILDGECMRKQREAMSSEIDSALLDIIANGSVLLASCKQNLTGSSSFSSPDLNLTGSSSFSSPDLKVPANVATIAPTRTVEGVRNDGELEIVEMDAVELLAEHVHFCEICGKGFKRDANLRMHMRAHGNQYKTQEALANPSATPKSAGRVRFSCPFAGCRRNQGHRSFRPLKSAVCVKNHFKRSHCPKMHACNKCNRKSFSVLADLKSHLKHCGETRWACSCGTMFSRKDKLFGHMALFEGHMPAVEERKELTTKDDERLDTGASISGLIGEEIAAIDGNYFDGSVDDFFGMEMETGLAFFDTVAGDDEGSFEQLF